MTTTAAAPAATVGINFASLSQAVPAIQDVSDMLAAFRTLETVPAAVAGSGSPFVGTAIAALGAEIVGVIVELVQKLEDDSKALLANIEKYAENEAATVLGLNTVAGSLGGAATAATATTGVVASALKVSPTATPVSVVPPTVNSGVNAAPAVNTNAASSLTVGTESTTLGTAVNNSSVTTLIDGAVGGPSVLDDLAGMTTIA